MLLLADGSADFARALGLEIDLSGGGLGVRSKRFSAIIEDGVVTDLTVEDDGSRPREERRRRALLAKL